MNDKILEFITELDSSSYEEFILNANIESKMQLDDEINDYNYSWLNQVEQYLPFISNIVNAKHGYGDNYVLKSYENRFIKTLLYRLKEFLISEQYKFNKINFSTNAKYLNANLKTIVNNEIVDVEIKVKSSQKEDLKRGESYGLSLNERIKRVLDITDSLINSNFINLLSDTSVVSDPISKTAIFEEELNYRKSLELYNIIENFNECPEDKDLEKIKQVVDEKLMITSFFEYQLLKMCNKKKSDDNVYRLFIERLIEKMVSDSSMDEKSFKKMLSKKFEDEYNKKKNRERNIQNIFSKNIDNYNKQIKDALRSLKN